MAGVLGHASFERGDPPGLLLEDSEQMNDQLAYDEWGLSPTDGIQRKPCWQWERNHHRTLLCHATGSLRCG
jgi:hypothetical protein